jgi:hypothetical protein
MTVFLVAGARKARAVRAIQRQPPDAERCPAQIVLPRAGETVLLVDREAAGETARSVASPGGGTSRGSWADNGRRGGTEAAS